MCCVMSFRMLSEILFCFLNDIYQHSNAFKKAAISHQNPFCCFHASINLLYRLWLPDVLTSRLPTIAPRLDQEDSHNRDLQLVRDFAAASQLLHEDNYGSCEVVAGLSGCCHRLGPRRCSRLFPYDSGFFQSISYLL